MAYPGELEHIEYLQYVERVSTGEEEGPQMTKDEWRKKKKKRDSREPQPVKVNALEYGR